MEADADMYNAMQTETRPGSPIPFSRSVGWTTSGSEELYLALRRVVTDPRAHRLAKRREYKNLLGEIQTEPMVAGWRDCKYITKITTSRYVLRCCMGFRGNTQRLETYDPWSKDWETHAPYIIEIRIMFSEPDAASVYEGRLNEAVRHMILSDDKELVPTVEVTSMCAQDLLGYSE